MSRVAICRQYPTLEAGYDFFYMMTKYRNSLASSQKRRFIIAAEPVLNRSLCLIVVCSVEKMLILYPMLLKTKVVCQQWGKKRKKVRKMHLPLNRWASDAVTI